MNTESADTLANSNPALGALVIYSFVRGYNKSHGGATHFALAFLPIPIALSHSLALTFAGTSNRTGLHVWLQRNPWLRLELAGHVRDASSISRGSLIFGIQHGIISVDGAGGLNAHPHQLFREPRDWATPNITARPQTISSRLGMWCGKLPRPAAVFSALELQP